MNPVAPSPYQAVAGEPARDRDAVLSIWAGHLGQASQHAAKYEWFYRQCPFGSPLLQLLRHVPSGQWVGTCAAGPRRMLWQGEELQAGVLVDMAVLPQHRSLGPAMIAQAALMAAADARFGLLYGFPNRKSLPVVQRLGYGVLGEMHRRARVLRYRGYLPRVLAPPVAAVAGALLDAAAALAWHWRRWHTRHCRAQWSDRVDPRMDALWAASPPLAGPVTVRDCRFLAWRFDASPLVRTRYLLLADADGRLRAWFACQAQGATLQVRDFWSHQGANGMPRDCLDALAVAAWRAGHAAVSVEFAGSEAAHRAWQAAGFSARDRRPVIGRWAPAAGDPGIPGYHFTAADEDE